MSQTRSREGPPKTFSISLHVDATGYIGRECPQDTCNRYFKVTPGTGLKGTSTCRCPYCGHEGPSETFSTRAQIDYALSVVKNKIVGSLLKDLKSVEFRHSGGGLEMSVKAHGRARPIRGYSEQDLETECFCDACTLRYAIYGVFGFCPDCGGHNNLSILDANLRVATKILSLGATVDAEVAKRLVENALEDCVSAFDGWGRTVCDVFAAKGADPAKAGRITFQNVMRAQEALKTQFSVDAEAGLGADGVFRLHSAFQKRHLFSHRMGVVDDEYVRQTGDRCAQIGHRVAIAASEVEQMASGIRAWAEALNGHLGRMP